MKQMDLRKRGDEWVLESGHTRVLSAGTKAEALQRATATAKREPDSVSLRIHGLNGQIQEERTYPRSADPRRSKG
jgi:hypothetical protein